MKSASTIWRGGARSLTRPLADEFSRLAFELVCGLTAGLRRAFGASHARVEVKNDPTSPRKMNLHEKRPSVYNSL